MAPLTHLVDTSVFARLSQPVVSGAFAPLAATGRVAICSPVAFELGYSARSARDHDDLTRRLDAFPTAPTGEADLHRALGVQAMLARRGQHRALSLVDALVAAVAESRALRVLHYDADFELVAAVTGQEHEWIVERGTAD